MLEKQASHIEQKEAIAKAAASLIGDSQRIMITNGTTSALIARYLLGRRAIQIVSNSTLLIPYARVNPNISLTIVGGEFRPSAEAFVGPIANRHIGEYHVEYTFTGTDGVTAEYGLTTHLSENAEIVRQMCNQAKKRVLVADSSKFGKQGFVKICPLTDIDIIITDQGLEPESMQIMTDMGLKVIVV